MATRICVVGGGVSGLSAALTAATAMSDGIVRRLESIAIVERCGSVGGRACTQRVANVAIDHGAQCWKISHDDVRRLGVDDGIREIRGPIKVFDKDSLLQTGDTEQEKVPKLTYETGIQEVAIRLRDKLLQCAQKSGFSVDFLMNKSASSLRRCTVSQTYSILDADGGVISAANIVILAQPAPEASALISNSKIDFDTHSIIEQLQKVKYRKAISVGFGTEERPNVDFYAAVNLDRQHPISWIAWEHHKPGRLQGSDGLVIAQMSPSYSSDHWPDFHDGLLNTEQVENITNRAEIDRIYEQISRISGTALKPWKWAHVKKWDSGLPYLQPENLASFEIINQVFDQLILHLYYSPFITIAPFSVVCC
eukprot:TRINITY_DN1059_c0_g1_i1.p1 TRINITY_DN1059_c0_g1~~TRINITY_DN1059_c0_g1_i1.p1  ORF type:complete len:366 (+),score=62.50 TRINITY_DN1059_c0_g1_i1:53-1150(+)